MDIQQLRSWAEVTDRALVISTVVAILAIAAVGVSAWFSVRISGAIRAEEASAFDRYRIEWGRHAAQLEAETAKAAQRIEALEKTAEQAERLAADAERRAAEADGLRNREAERADLLQREAADARQRLADTQRQIALAAQLAASPKAAQPRADEPSSAPPSAPAPTLPAQGLARFAGTRAAIYIVDDVPEGTTVGASIETLLGEAGWAPGVWRWTGVGGIVGVVVLIREGGDPTTEAAAQDLLETLQRSGFNAAKGHWPADWRRFKGNLLGPQAPAPTDAPIRIVVGLKAR